MKIFRSAALSVFLILSLASCKKDTENVWKVEIKNPVQHVTITDISKEFYNPQIPLQAFNQKYPWFQGTVSDEAFGVRRSDEEEAKIYNEAIAKIDVAKLSNDLTDLFSHVKHYFPEFAAPKVYLYSSALQGIMEPIFYQPEQNLLFIDVSGFMGENNANYKGLEQYWQTEMNPQNIVPRVSTVFSELMVPRNNEHQKFIDELIYHGKLMTLQDAFLPDFPDYLKIGYTQKQYEWAKANEANIWNYIVENDLVFSDDSRLKERFINPGPFSKFYTEIDNESSPRVGIFSGWQITKKIFKSKPDIKIKDFLKMNSQDIFNQSNYKPKN